MISKELAEEEEEEEEEAAEDEVLHSHDLVVEQEERHETDEKADELESKQSNKVDDFTESNLEEYEEIEEDKLQDRSDDHENSVDKTDSQLFESSKEKSNRNEQTESQAEVGNSKFSVSSMESLNKKAEHSDVTVNKEESQSRYEIMKGVQRLYGEKALEDLLKKKKWNRLEGAAKQELDQQMKTAKKLIKDKQLSQAEVNKLLKKEFNEKITKKSEFYAKVFNKEEKLVSL